MGLRRHEEPWERAIRFIRPWMEARPNLTEGALLRLAESIRSDFWRTRRRNRENRRIIAERAA